jgi:hypothetical protein
MKHHILEVSLAVLIGAAHLGADTWKTCANACSTALTGCQNEANTAYSSSVATYNGYYTTCINAFSTGTTYGGCLTTAYNNDCVPLVDGNCNNPTAWGSDFTACGNLFLGPSGTCASVQTTEVNGAYSTQQGALSTCNVQNGTCVGNCPSAGTCASDSDCTDPNFNTGVDQGPVCSPSFTCVASGDDGDDGDGDGDGGGEGGCGCGTSGQSCNNDGDCESGLICNSDSGTCTTGDDPIIIDLSGAGFLLTNVQNGVEFDFDGGGKLAPIAWTQRNAKVGFLALSREANGLVDDGADLFGNMTPQPGGPIGGNGYKALAVFDQPTNGGNGDGQITVADAIWPRLRIWVDANHDGVSQPSELLTLDQAGVRAISLSYTASHWQDAYGNQFRYRGQITWSKPVNGKIHAVIYDVVLQH